MPFGKNASPCFSLEKGIEDLCGNKWSYAFFVRSSIWDCALFIYRKRGEKKMALVECPDCGQKVSDQAKVCIHCGCPLGKKDYTVKVKTPRGQGSIVTVSYTFTDDKTGKTLATAHQNEVVSFVLEQPTTIRCHLGRGFKDALLEYQPHENARYNVVQHNTMFKAFLAFQEVDVIDSD